MSKTYQCGLLTEKTRTPREFNQLRNTISAMIEGIKTPTIFHVLPSSDANKAVRAATHSHPHITVKIHYSDLNGKGYYERMSEIRRNAGRMAAEIDGLIILTETPSQLDQQIINKAQDRHIAIETAKIKTASPAKPGKTYHMHEKNMPYRVNIRNYATWTELTNDLNNRDIDGKQPIYCGAASEHKKVKGSPLANQWRGRADWQQKYKAWLWSRIQAKDPAIMRELSRISPTTPLVCWCHGQKECHTDIIRKAAAYVRKNTQF
jgi:hypothetical protein